MFHHLGLSNSESNGAWLPVPPQPMMPTRTLSRGSSSFLSFLDCTPGQSSSAVELVNTDVHPSCRGQSFPAQACVRGAQTRGSAGAGRSSFRGHRENDLRSTARRDRRGCRHRAFAPNRGLVGAGFYRWRALGKRVSFRSAAIWRGEAGRPDTKPSLQMEWKVEVRARPAWSRWVAQC
jgi:hypothetical protein